MSRRRRTFDQCFPRNRGLKTKTTAPSRRVRLSGKKKSDHINFKKKKNRYNPRKKVEALNGFVFFVAEAVEGSFTVVYRGDRSISVFLMAYASTNSVELK